MSVRKRDIRYFVGKIYPWSTQPRSWSEAVEYMQRCEIADGDVRIVNTQKPKLLSMSRPPKGFLYK